MRTKREENLKPKKKIEEIRNKWRHPDHYPKNKNDTLIYVCQYVSKMLEKNTINKKYKIIICPTNISQREYINLKRRKNVLKITESYENINSSYKNLIKWIRKYFTKEINLINSTRNNSILIVFSFTYY